MTYPFFNRVLKQLNRVLKYEAAVGYAGNGFFEKSSDFIQESNPLFEDASDNVASYGERMANMLNMGMIKVREKEEGERDRIADEFGLQFGT